MFRRWLGEETGDLQFWRMRSVFILTRKLCSQLIFVFDDGIMSCFFDFLFFESEVDGVSSLISGSSSLSGYVATVVVVERVVLAIVV
jgi:hypothetical protein